MMTKIRGKVPSVIIIIKGAENSDKVGLGIQTQPKISNIVYGCPFRVQEKFNTHIAWQLILCDATKGCNKKIALRI